MKYIDDILYLLGWVCVIAVTSSIDVRAGGYALGAAFFLTSYIFARYRGRRD